MCNSPLVGIKYGVDSSTGKYKIKIKRRIDFSLNDYYKRYGKENVVLIPCGHCSDCILQRRREWSVRCVLEGLCHQENCFVTLTYDDEHYPSYKVWRTDYQRFIKKLRDDGHKVRFFGCGELGSQTGRRHLHIILFGFIPKDISYDGESESGEALFTSRYIDSIWKKGRAIVQFFEGSVGSYVAGYTSKKLGSSEGFQFQSNHPGIGAAYFLQNKDKLMKYDKIFGPFGSSKLPRYFEKLLNSDFYLEILKESRMKLYRSELYRQARIHNFANIDEMINYSRSFNDRKLNCLVRSL